MFPSDWLGEFTTCEDPHRDERRSWGASDWARAFHKVKREMADLCVQGAPLLAHQHSGEQSDDEDEEDEQVDDKKQSDGEEEEGAEGQSNGGGEGGEEGSGERHSYRAGDGGEERRGEEGQVDLAHAPGASDESQRYGLRVVDHEESEGTELSTEDSIPATVAVEGLDDINGECNSGPAVA